MRLEPADATPRTGSVDQSPDRFTRARAHGPAWEGPRCGRFVPAEAGDHCDAAATRATTSAAVRPPRPRPTRPRAMTVRRADGEAEDDGGRGTKPRVRGGRGRRAGCGGRRGQECARPESRIVSRSAQSSASASALPRPEEGTGPARCPILAFLATAMSGTGRSSCRTRTWARRNPVRGLLVFVLVVVVVPALPSCRRPCAPRAAAGAPRGGDRASAPF